MFTPRFQAGDMISHLESQLFLRDRIISGRISFDGHIRNIMPLSRTTEHYILPSFIDGHVHGKGRTDTMDGVAAIKTLFRFHLAHDTTPLLLTTITIPWAEVMGTLRAVADVCDWGAQDGSRIHGAHLGVPFVSPTSWVPSCRSISNRQAGMWPKRSQPALSAS